MKRFQWRWLTVATALTALAVGFSAGCDEPAAGSNPPPAQALDPYAPPRPAPAMPPKPGQPATNNAALEQALFRVEGKLDETLKLLYDISVVNDRRFAALEAKLAAQTALLQKDPVGGTTTQAPVPAPAPEARKAPAWTADQRKWIDQYTAKFAGDKPAAPKSQENELIGGKLPVTRYLSITGGAFDLNDYVKQKQRVVLVILRGFSGSICLYCSSQTLALSRAEEEFKKRNTQVVLIYPGEADTVPMFLEAVNNLDPKTEVPFPIGMDVDLSAIHQFRIRGELAKPASIIVDETGVVRYAYVGADPTDRPTVKDLLGALDKLDKK